MDNLKKISKGRVKFNKYFIMFTFILFILVTGSTYAYYAFRYENDSVITGNVISINVELDVERVVGTNTKLVPLQDEALANALKGTGSSNGACIDNVSNLSCQVYKITLTNLGSRIQHVNGTIELYPKSGSGNAYSNLKWRELSNTTTIKTGSVINGMSKSTLVSDLTMESKEEKVWYIAVWLSEVDYDQYDIDKGIFEGTVTFEAGGSGDSGDSGGSGDSGDVIQYLNTVEVGSYVLYTGNNGCVGNACSGQNANYVSSSNMGYCGNSNNKFTTTGWRVAYIKNDTAYLISAGAVECINGSSYSGGSSFVSELNNRALKYCNSSFSYGGSCNSNSSWVISENDFNVVTYTGASDCYDINTGGGCGLNNDLINNGGLYWFGTTLIDYDGQDDMLWFWIGDYLTASGYNEYSAGVRPIIRLKSDVMVTGGLGTSSSPYVISS